MTEKRVNPETGVWEEKHWYGWSPSENSEGHQERVNPDTGVHEEKHWYGWSASENSEGHQERVNPDTGVHEEKHWYGWSPDDSSEKGLRRSPLRPTDQHEQSAASSTSSYSSGSAYDTDSSYSQSSFSTGSRSPTPVTNGSLFPAIIVGVLTLIGLALFQSPSTVRQQPSTTLLQTSVAPENIIINGDCPFEGCKYNERWLAKQDVDVYFAPPNAVGVPVTSLQKAAVIHKGDWVKTETGIVLSTRGEGSIDLKNHTEWGNDIANGSPSIANNPPLKDGEVISIYGSGSEGCYRTFFAEKPFVVCNVGGGKFRAPKYEWWIQIKTADGSKAWTHSANQPFVSEDGLKDELAQKIADTKLSLTDKLAQVDDFLKVGGDINGYAGQYGTAPFEAAIRTNDINLLSALMSNGLDIRNKQTCTAYIAASNALTLGGDLMLEFLLQKDMPLDCLHQPPIHEFLMYGIGTDNYPVEQAIRVTEIIANNGIMRINERNSQGQTIFDVLDRLPANAAAHIHPLREALTKMSQ